MGDDQDEMLEREAEYQAFAAAEWAANRQRIVRSKGYNAAAQADMCLQDPERDHGGRLGYDRHSDVQCAHCNSSIGTDADTMTEFRTSAQPPAAADGRERQIGVRIGEGN